MYAIIMALSETEANEDRIQNSKVTLFLTHVRHSSRKTWQTKQAVLCNHKWEEKKFIINIVQSWKYLACISFLTATKHFLPYLKEF